MDPRRPPLRRHRQERRDLLFGGGLRIHTTVDLDMQAQAEAAVAAILPDPQRPRRLARVDRAGDRLRAGHGRRPRLLRRRRVAKLNLAIGRPAGRLVVQAARARRGPRRRASPHPGSRRPACITIRLANAAPWRLQLRRRRRRHRHPRRGDGAVLQHALRQLDHAGRAEAAIEAATRYGIMSPLEPVPVGACWEQRRDRHRHGRRLRHLRQPGRAGAAGARHPHHPRRRHRALHPEHHPDQVLDPASPTRSPCILEQVWSAAPAPRPISTGRRRARPAPPTHATPGSWASRRSWPPRCGSGFPELGAEQSSRCRRPAPRSGSPAAPTRRRSGSTSWRGARPARPSVAFPAPTTTTTTRPPCAGTASPTPAAGQPVPDVVGRRRRGVAALQAAGFERAHRVRRRGHQAPGHGRRAVAPPAAPRPRVPVTLEVRRRVATRLGSPGEADAVPDAPPLARARPRRPRPRASLVVVVVVRMVAMWGYVLYLAVGPGGSRRRTGWTTRLRRAAAGGVPGRARDVAALPPAGRRPTPRPSAPRSSRGQRAVRPDARRPRAARARPVRRARSSASGSPTGTPTSMTVRSTPTRSARTPRPACFVTARDGEQVTEYIDAFARTTTCRPAPRRSTSS